jgi:hypothetical protein
MEGLAASVLLIAILLGVLLVVAFDVFCLLHLGKADTAHFLPKFVWAVLIVCISPLGGLVYLLAQRLPKRSPEPPMKPVNRGIGVAWVILVLLVIGLWVGIKSASHPQPQPAVPLTCPTGPIWAPSRGCASSYEVARVRSPRNSRAISQGHERSTTATSRLQSRLLNSFIDHDLSNS